MVDTRLLDHFGGSGRWLLSKIDQQLLDWL